MEPLRGQTAETSGFATVSTKPQRIAKLARGSPQRAFTTLAHHRDLDWLREADRRTRKDGAVGADGQTACDYEADLESNLRSLQERAKFGTYHAPPVRRVPIPKGDGSQTRPMGIPTFEDKVLQRAVAMILEAVYEQDFLDCSYGFRPGRSAHQALQGWWDPTMRRGGGRVLEIDIRQFFDTLDHAHLRNILSQRVRDGVRVRLIGKWLHAGVLESGGVTPPESGSPQGGLISPLLANIYLHPLDVLMREAGFERVRYADNLVVLCRTAAEAEQALRRIQEWVASAGLTLPPDKTRIVEVRPPGGFDFLGYHFERGRRWPRRSSMQKLRDTIRRQTKRNHGHSLEGIIADLNPRLRGWFAYFQHSYRTTFPYRDGWIRLRLRSLLRRRSHRRGRGRDHQHWPNAYFACHGLFSLYEAWRCGGQSLRAH